MSAVTEVRNSQNWYDRAVCTSSYLPKKPLIVVVAAIISGSAFYQLRPDSVLTPSTVFSITFISAWAYIATVNYVAKNVLRQKTEASAQSYKFQKS